MGIAHVLKTVKQSDSLIIVSDELLQRIHSDLIIMMDDIVEVCEANHIKWFLSGGGILGAVRHKGFIPWDDDIDIFMERSDYEKFKSIFNETMSKKYRLRKPGDEGYLLNIAQIQKVGTKVQMIQSTEDSDEGLFVDIFILENTYNDVIRRCVHGIVSTFFLFVCSAMRMEACKINIIKYSDGDENIIHEVQKRARFAHFFQFWSLEKWLMIADRYFSHVKERGRLLVCPGGSKHFFGEIFESKWFDEPTKRKFENETWNVPNPPEKYLSVRYGRNYMELPKEEDRERHIFIKLDLGEQRW